MMVLTDERKKTLVSFFTTKIDELTNKNVVNDPARKIQIFIMIFNNLLTRDGTLLMADYKNFRETVLIKVEEILLKVHDDDKTYHSIRSIAEQLKQNIIDIDDGLCIQF